MGILLGHLKGVDAAARNARIQHDALGLLGGVRPEERLHRLLQYVTGLAAERDDRRAFGEQLAAVLQTEHGQRGAHHAGTQDERVDGHAVLADVGAVAGARRAVRPLAHGQRARVQVVQRIEALAAQHGLVLGNVHAVALAGSLRVDVAGQRADAGHEARVVVRHLGKREHRQAIGIAVHLHEAAVGLADAVERGARHVRRIARLTEARDVRDGQLRVDLPQRFVGHAPLRHLAAAEAVHEDVRLLEQLEEPGAARAVLHVHAQRARVASLHLRAPPLQRLIGGTRGVAAARAFHADDLGAQVGQQAAGERARDGHGEVDHLHPLQRAELRAILSFHTVPPSRRCHPGERLRNPLQN